MPSAPLSAATSQQTSASSLRSGSHRRAAGHDVQKPNEGGCGVLSRRLAAQGDGVTKIRKEFRRSAQASHASSPWENSPKSSDGGRHSSTTGPQGRRPQGNDLRSFTTEAALHMAGTHIFGLPPVVAAVSPAVKAAFSAFIAVPDQAPNKSIPSCFLNVQRT